MSVRPWVADALARLCRPSGTFAMVAMDQRESLRTMLAERGLPDDLESRVAFKVAVARILSPHASALLVDVDEGLGPILAAGALAPGCGLIVAADELVQAPGEPVDDTRLDPAVDLAEAARLGAAAAKLLVIWRADRPAAGRAELVGEFLERARAAGLLGIVEAVARPPAGIPEAEWTDRAAAVLDAAREFAAYNPDIYKAQVPSDGQADGLVDRCREMSRRLTCPWVVLSSGVEIEDFPSAVEAACRGGAAGFLAGRAVWRDAIGADPGRALLDRSVRRLGLLGEIVDTHAVPWWRAPT